MGSEDMGMVGSSINRSGVGDVRAEQFTVVKEVEQWITN